MQDLITWALSYPFIKGALTGLGSAMVVDFAAFRRWQSFGEAREYGWNIALWRWFQGAVTGAIVGSGLGVAE